jgi:hypothetical protein
MIVPPAPPMVVLPHRFSKPERSVYKLAVAEVSYLQTLSAVGAAVPDQQTPRFLQPDVELWQTEIRE